MIGEDWMHRGVGGLVVAGLTALAGFARWLFTRKQQAERNEAETDGVRADVMRKYAEADEVRRVAVNGSYRGALQTADSLVAAVRSEMDRLRADLAAERKEREEDAVRHRAALAAEREASDDAKVELRACRREAHALRADMEALRREMDLVRRQLDEERKRRGELEGKVSSYEGRIGGECA